MSDTTSIQFVHEGAYMAKVKVNLIPDDEGWGPYLAPEEARKLDEVRIALRKGDVAAASRLATVFRLIPVSAA